jgi:hypothetical protein
VLLKSIDFVVVVVVVLESVRAGAGGVPGFG